MYHRRGVELRGCWSLAAVVFIGIFSPFLSPSLTHTLDILCKHIKMHKFII